jgi:hypothetical protein
MWRGNEERKRGRGLQASLAHIGDGVEHTVVGFDPTPLVVWYLMYTVLTCIRAYVILSV